MSNSWRKKQDSIQAQRLEKIEKSFSFSQRGKAKKRKTQPEKTVQRQDNFCVLGGSA